VIATKKTYDSEADGKYLSKADIVKVSMPILRESDRRVAVANTGASKFNHVTWLSFSQLPEKAAETDTFDEVLAYLMSVGKTRDDGNVSVFTNKDVKTCKEKDILITGNG
jgi:hypothetical protein